MIHPTSYLSPEECAMGEGLRILSDDRFYVVPEPEPLPVEQLFEIDQALQVRVTMQEDWNPDEPLLSLKRLINAYFLYHWFLVRGACVYPLWRFLYYYRRPSAKYRDSNDEEAFV